MATDLRARAEQLWEQLGGELCICQRADVWHWCENCQRKINIIQSALAAATPAHHAPSILHLALTGNQWESELRVACGANVDTRDSPPCYVWDTKSVTCDACLSARAARLPGTPVRPARDYMQHLDECQHDRCRQCGLAHIGASPSHTFEPSNCTCGLDAILAAAAPAPPERDALRELREKYQGFVERSAHDVTREHDNVGCAMRAAQHRLAVGFVKELDTLLAATPAPPACIGDDHVFLVEPLPGAGQQILCKCGRYVSGVADAALATPPVAGSTEGPEMTEAGDAPHPLQRFYDDPEWMARYRAGLRAELEALDKSALVDIVLRNRATPPGAEPSEPEKERT